MDELSNVSRELATELRAYARRADAFVVAITPETAPLAAEIAHTLHVPFDIFLVRALQATERRESLWGIVGSGGVLVLDPAEAAAQGVSRSEIATAAQSQARVLARMERELRDGQMPLDVRAATVIVVDDGSASVPLLRMAISALRQSWVAGVVVARPAITVSELAILRMDADAIVSTLVPDGARTNEMLRAASPATLDTVRALLQQSVSSARGLSAALCPAPSI